MKLLSDEDLDLRNLSDEELAKAWDLWFDLAQHTNDHDPPYSHGVFAGLEWKDLLGTSREDDRARS
jgi:hypothetical protein